MSLVSLSTYPISTPLHGGQRRVAAIVAAARAAGIEATHVPLHFAADFPEATAEERRTALPAGLRQPLFEAGKLQDLHLSEVLTADHPSVRAALARIAAARPRVIAFEHPWLYPVLGPAIAADPALREARLVYSAHNVESALMPARYRDEAAALERRLAAAADLVAAVSEEDAATLRGWTAAPVVVAPNGAHPPAPVPAGTAPVVAEPYALFAGSAHQPNLDGYWDSFGAVPGFVPPDCRLVVAGGVNNLLGGDPRHQRFRLLNAALVRNMGVVSEAVLSNLLAFARVICLPVTGGGGTNLKTAEALLSGKPIVARRAAFRGFESHAGLPGVHLAEDAAGFRRLVRQALLGEIGGTRSPADVASLTWDAALAPLIQAYGSLTET